MSLLSIIREKAQLYAPEVINLRRRIHQNPELSYQEFQTSALVTDELRKLGLNPVILATTGVMAEIHGKNAQKKTIALRADMDALPIQEENNVPYKSQNPGVMHACGHDVHTASLLGTAKILNDLRDRFEGTVRLIFQPGEEKNPGGASLLIKEGVLQNPQPACIIGQHVFPLLPAGKAGFRSGKYMASSDEIYITVIGKGGHGAAPELTVDPVVIAAHLIVALQQIISRKASPKQPSVLTFGRITAAGSTNIIPDKVEMAGTFRTLNEVWREQALKEIEKMAVQLTESMGGKCEINISRGYPYLENNEELTRRLRQSAEEYLGKENVADLDITMGSEDFAYYSQIIPASFYRLGTRNEARGITSYVHTPTFDVDEDALITGIGLMAWLAVCELNV
ncbi:MAG: M20 family metallopeptidase [Cyclobacteriaceae bacterium]|nr:M20 family metallopeptidase [Cyclobacteriaceae bacterium]MDW8330949.1 M20 family metallopeptidase [Cyclobacteriaceae bacterium]